MPNFDKPGAGEGQAVPPKVWAKPTMRVLVAGYFSDVSPDGNFRSGYYEGCAGQGTYPPSVTCQYINPPS